MDNQSFAVDLMVKVNDEYEVVVEKIKMKEGNDPETFIHHLEKLRTQLKEMKVDMDNQSFLIDPDGQSH